MLLDADVRFDKDTQRYYLTEYFVQNQIGRDLNVISNDELDIQPSTLPQRQIEYACDLLWDFIETNAFDGLSTKYYLSNNEQGFKAMKRALMHQLMFVINVGDTNKAVGNKANDGIDKSAIRTLRTVGAFHIKILSIPAIENW